MCRKNVLHVSVAYFKRTIISLSKLPEQSSLRKHLLSMLLSLQPATLQRVSSEKDDFLTTL